MLLLLLLIMQFSSYFRVLFVFVFAAKPNSLPKGCLFSHIPTAVQGSYNLDLYIKSEMGFLKTFVAQINFESLQKEC